MELEDKIKDGDKLIGEFVGARVIEAYPWVGVPADQPKDFIKSYNFDYGALDGKLWPRNERYHTSASVKYYTSWDWLMSVVEKIESLELTVNIEERFCRICGYTLNFKGTSIYYYKKTRDVNKIKATWIAIIDFINWYNYEIQK